MPSRLLLASTFLTALQLLAPGISHAGPQCKGIDKTECPESLAYESARGLSIGTGMRASALSTSALAYSPGALSLGNLYHIEGNIDYLGAFNTVALGGAVVDSSTSKLGAGIAVRGFLSGEGGSEVGDDIDGLDGRVGLGLALSDAFAIGLLGRYLSVSSEEQVGDDIEETELASGFTLDASLRLTPTEGFQIDVAALNFVDLESVMAPVMFTGGLAIAAIDALSIGGDVLIDMTTFDDPELILGGGLEFLASGAIPLRAGYRADLARETHSITAGVGYTDQQVGFDLGLRQDVSGDNETRVIASMRYYVH